MSYKKNKHKKEEQEFIDEDEEALYGDTDILFYDEVLINDFLAAFAALIGKETTRNLTGTVSNMLGFTYYNNILKPEIESHMNLKSAGWHSKGIFIQKLLTINEFYNYINTNSVIKNGRDTKWLMAQFDEFRANYVKWSAFE